MLVASCTETPSSVAKAIEIKSDYKAKINASAGDYFEDDAFKPMPIFFNVGTMDINESTSAETIILSDKLSKGKTVKIKPVSLLRFEKDTAFNNYIISVPADSTKNVLNIHDYHDFSQEHYQIKFLLEDWFRGNCKLGRCGNFEWQSEVQALKLIE